MLFSELKKNLNKDRSGMPERRLALLGDSATQFLAKAIQAYGQAIVAGELGGAYNSSGRKDDGCQR